jgi:hypothetical protein
MSVMMSVMMSDATWAALRLFNAFYERLGDPVDHSVSDRCDVLGLSDSEDVASRG